MSGQKQLNSRDYVARRLDGLISVALFSIKLHLKVPSGNWFFIRSVSGVRNSVVTSDSRDADVDSRELRYDKYKEMLADSKTLTTRKIPNGSPSRKPRLVSLTRSIDGRRNNRAAHTGFGLAALVLSNSEVQTPQVSWMQWQNAWSRCCKIYIPFGASCAIDFGAVVAHRLSLRVISVDISPPVFNRW